MSGERNMDSNKSERPAEAGMRRCPRIVLGALLLVIFLSGVSLCRQAYAQTRNTSKQPQKTENYRRPKPSGKVKPTIPGVSRFQPNRVFLEYADSLVHRMHDSAQIVSGNVKFRQGGMWMFCDSAYYYPDRNSMDAFGNVKMQQGDTLFVFSDKLYYDGNTRFARLYRGPSRSKVELRDPQGKLETDTLYYDVLAELGNYNCGGVLSDDVNTLTSRYGEYSPATHDASFYWDVELHNRKDGYRLISDTLYYNTRNHRARIASPTTIFGANDTVRTSSGWYNTLNDSLELTSRSLIVHRDSLNRVTTIEGDSIVYDRKSRVSRAYAFRDPHKQSRPTVLTDTANKMTLTGNYGLYNDSTREAFSTGYPLLVEYSRPDTLYLRADTIRTYIFTEMVWPDSLKVRAARFTPSRVPQVFPEEELAKFRPAPEESASVDSLPPLSLPRESLPGDSLQARPAPVPVLPPDSSLMVPRDVHIAKAYHRARFFNKDIQGVADSLVFRESDSLLLMYRRPVVWSENRQLSGNQITVHLNDSTADWAYLPENAFSVEHVDEDFYNQLKGKQMKADFIGRTLKQLDVAGNVQTIFLPMEEDSTYNRLVNASGAYLTIDMENNDVKHLRMWPEVSGEVVPLFLVKKTQKYLPGFSWLERIRPRRKVVDGRILWDDDLGEVPEELEQWLGNDN